MTPLERARLAKKAGTSTASAKPARAPLPQFAAPADFKPHFVEITVRTEADGLLGTDIRCVRYQGRYDVNAEDKKKSDMSAYDMKTMIGIQARLSALTFKPTNDRKYSVIPAKRIGVKGSNRLPAGAVFVVVVRVNKRSKDGTLATPIKFVQQKIKNKETGRVKTVDLAKDDPVARVLKRVARYLPAAFKNVQQPPARRRGRAADADE
jgi:hypothetical protein